jgi:5-methylcytosine-specific restriction endonuclease McrA
MVKMEIDLEKAWDHCRKNEEEIDKSNKCGCFYCLSVFGKKEIVDHILERDGNETIRCPICTIDSVIGDASGLPVESEWFLKEMNKYWFSPAEEMRV